MRKSRKSHAETKEDLDVLAQALDLWRARQDESGHWQTTISIQ